ncbi:hypothetical protein [Gemmata sp.]|uniref:hypothetical protein n=1 Tax=Gemmata sp. TaxID=1914242 RepID=UPI003F6F8B86
MLTPVCDPATAVVDPVWAYYAANLRAGMFTGFLTMSSFLLTMTTFIIMNLKAQYYDQTRYADRVKKRRQVGCKRSYYRPLQNLGIALIASIALSLLTSIAQFTVGLYPSFWSVVVCGTLALLAVGALVVSLIQIGFNMSALFQAWNEEKDTSPSPAAA